MLASTFFFKVITSMAATALGFGPAAPLINLNFDLPVPVVSNGSLQKFASCNSLKSQLDVAEPSYNGYMMRDMVMMPMATAKSSTLAAEGSAAGASNDFSSTNIQVTGVDEADIVKQDGEFLYHLSNNKLMISRVYSADKATLISTNEFPQNFSATDMYLQGSRLMLLGSSWQYNDYPMPMVKSSRIMPPWPRSTSLTTVLVYDISDRASIKQIRTVEFEGNLNTSRLVDGYAYLVMDSYSPYDGGIMPLANADGLIPSYRDSNSGDKISAVSDCSEVGYFDPEPTRNMLVIASVPMDSDKEVRREVILGSSETVYASTQNIYVARRAWESPAFYDSIRPQDNSGDQTQIYKFAFSSGAVKFQNSGKVQGHLLNQFSLDEYNGDLRVATTKGEVWRGPSDSSNNLYILGADMNARGNIENLAPGEKIYSVRFMGPRAYMVTFKKVDPLFVLDASNPDAPKVLGKLKIPGYSDYLHPIDSNHLIGLGKNAVEAAEGDFAWYQGIKMAIFDVTDVTDPKEMWKTEIGDRGTDSPALYDHKAFLYSPEKQLLSLPIRLAELSPEVKADSTREGNEYGDFKFQGAYVYRLTLDKGFELLGRVTHHADDDAALKSGYYWGDWDTDIQRVLYNSDSLITVSNSQVELSHLYDLTTQAVIKYPKADQPQPVPMMY